MRCVAIFAQGLTQRNEGEFPQRAKMTLYEDIDTIGGQEDVSKTKRVRSHAARQNQGDSLKLRMFNSRRAGMFLHVQTMGSEIFFSKLSYLNRTECFMCCSKRINCFWKPVTAGGLEGLRFLTQGDRITAQCSQKGREGHTSMNT